MMTIQTLQSSAESEIHDNEHGTVELGTNADELKKELENEKAKKEKAMKLCSKSIDEIKMLNEKLAGDSN
jgi:hypothetical protein